MNGTTALLAENEVVILPEICVAHALFQLPLPMSPQCCYCTGTQFYPPPGAVPLPFRLVGGASHCLTSSLLKPTKGLCTRTEQSVLPSTREDMQPQAFGDLFTYRGAGEDAIAVRIEPR